MNEQELLATIKGGETSKVQFKEKFPHPESISREITAMSNSIGGTILFGIEDGTNIIKGLLPEEINEIDKKIAECADNIKPAVYITTETIRVNTDNSEKYILAAQIKEGINKPYKTIKGEIYVKQGANKRLLTDNNEILRLFEQGGFGFIQTDEIEIHDTSIHDIDEWLFQNYFKNEFGLSYTEKGLAFEDALKAKKVVRNGRLTLAGILFFGKDPQFYLPQFTIKTVSFVGNSLGGNNYRNKPEDLRGPIPELYKQTMIFLKASLKHLQNGRGFNTIGELEVSAVALEEVVQNALIHRDYLKHAPIRVMIFDNRIEIISPGKLPNSLTVDEIKYGNPVTRNHQIAYFASRTMPYTGLGSGLRRAFENQPDIELINDVEGEQFIARFPRKG
jgi:predicted HTH transcriptional regulator